MAERRAARAAFLVAGATLVYHAVLILWLPMPGTFRKYSLAAEQFLAGELPAERLMDFSPLYFHLSVALERVFDTSEGILLGLQVVLTAAAAGILCRLFARRLPLALAAGSAAVLATDRHVLVYERILEPEPFLLAFLVATLELLERRTAWAGLCAALCLAIRPTFLPAFLLVPLYWRLRGVRGRALLCRSIGFLLPIAAVLVLLALRAAAATGDPRAPTMNPGTVFFEGNNPLSHGTSAIYPPLVLELVRHSGEIPDSAHVHYRTVARASLGTPPGGVSSGGVSPGGVSPGGTPAGGVSPGGTPASGTHTSGAASAGAASDAFAGAAGRAAASLAEVNAFWADRALAYARAEPGRFAARILDKLRRVFHGFRWHDVPSAWKYDRRLGLLPAFPFVVLSAFALIGLLFEVRRWRVAFLYYVFGASQLAVMLVFYVSARQRLVLLPFLLYFAAAAVERLLALRRRKALAWLALVAALMVASSIPDDAIRDEVYKRRGYLETEARLAEIRERTREAPLAHHAELAVEAIAAAPWWLDWLRPAYFPQEERNLEERVAAALDGRAPRDFPATLDLGAVLIEAGRTRDAARLLAPLAAAGKRVYRGGQQPSDPRVLFARALALEGERALAVSTLEAAHDDAPGDPFVLAELLALTDDPRYQEPLLAFWSPLDAQYLLGRALLVHGRAREAAAAFGFVVRRLPEFREARVLFAAALGASGRIEDGVRQYLIASRERLEPLLASREIVALFRRWAAAHPDSVEVRLQTAQVLHQHGKFREALQLLDGLEPGGELRFAVARERERILAALANPNSRSQRYK